MATVPQSIHRAQASSRSRSSGRSPRRQVNAANIFDDCYARYSRLRDWLQDSRGTVPSVDLESPSGGYQWRPDRSRACEYLADFERLGCHALRRPEWKGRLKLFEVYFVGGAEYRRAIRLVGVAEGTFDYWYGEVKRAAGAEFSRAGLHPPSRYFSALRSRGNAASAAPRRRQDSGPAHTDSSDAASLALDQRRGDRANVQP